MRRPSAFEVRRMEMGSNQAHSIRTLRVLKLISVSAPPITPPMPTARAASATTHMSFVSVRSAPSSVRIFSPALRAPHDDAVFLQLIEIESVQRLAQLEHHVIRDVHHVVDGVLADRFQALAAASPAKAALSRRAARGP